MALNRREKVMLSFPVLLGGVLSFYNWVHEPLFDRRASALEKVNQVQSELHQVENRLSREGDLTARRSAVTQREEMVDSWVPGKNSAGLLIWHLSEAEAYSQARIRSVVVTDREEVITRPAGEQAKVKGQTEADKAPAPPAEGSARTSALTVIQVQMQVDAHFAEHLLFNQKVEQFPLFLNVDGLSLVRAETLPLAEVGRLIATGNPFTAEQLLAESPVVSGTYQINLYFKSEKLGPSTGEMYFQSTPGRMDPFAMDGVSEFVQALMNHYTNPGPGDGTIDGRWNPARPGPQGQLG